MTACVVTVTPRGESVTFVKSWPSFSPVAEYLSQGTSRMAARPMMGYRRQDLDTVRVLQRDYVLGIR